MFISSIVAQRHVHIKNSSDDFPKSFMIREMYGCQWMILMGIIHDNLFNCRQPHQHIHLKGEETSITAY